MKKYLLLTILILAFYGVIAHADTTTYESGIFEYVIEENGVRITSCTDYNSETIEIPSEINGLPVVSVGGFIGNNIRKVKNITISEGVIEIDEMAFYYCDTLEKISLPSTLTSIGKSAFYNCDSLTELHIPKNVCSVGEEGSFRNCFSLPAITVDEENKWFSSLDGVLYNKDKTTLILYPAGKQNEKFYVPDSVIRINNSAFYNCDYLRELVFSDSIEEIGEGAVFYCDNISSIHIPKNVKLIEQVPFGVCDNLEEIIVSEENTCFSSEGGLLFDYDKKTVLFCVPISIESITVPNSVIEIADSAFRYSDIKNIVISQGTKYIGEQAFFNSHIKTIHIPNSVIEIKKSAFDACYDISKIYYDGSIEQWNDLIVNNDTNPYLSLATIYLNEEKILPHPDTSTEIRTYNGIKYADVGLYAPRIDKTKIYKLLFCQYKGDQLLSCNVETCEYLYNTEYYSFNLNADTDHIKVMIWDDLSNLNPLTKLREYNVNK